jgi:hypothetical protein
VGPTPVRVGYFWHTTFLASASSALQREANPVEQQPGAVFGPRDADVMFHEARATRRRAVLIAEAARKNIATAKLIRARRDNELVRRDRD